MTDEEMDAALARIKAQEPAHKDSPEWLVWKYNACKAAFNFAQLKVWGEHARWLGAQCTPAEPY